MPSGVSFCVRQIEINKAKYKYAITNKRDKFTPINMAAEYSHPIGKRSCRCNGMHVPA